MLEIISAHVSFGAQHVLQGVSCQFESGKITGLIGDNGAGKTTMLRVAATMLQPDQGELCLHGKRLVHDDVRSRTLIGALIEKPGHYDELTVRDNLEFFYSFHCPRREALTAAVDRALDRFALNAVTDQKAGSLSTGYRQRLAVARAIHPRASIVLLDEPLAGLDPTTRSSLKNELRRVVQRRVTVCVSSHGLADLEALCDRIYAVVEGKTYEFGGGFETIRTYVNAPPEGDHDEVYTQLITKLTATAS